jgi:putative lipoprotein
VSCTQLKESAEYMKLGPVEPVHAKTYVYECSDGYSFIINREDNKARLFFSEKSIVLPHAFSISSTKFSDRQTTLWIEEGVARLEIDSVMHENCYNNQAKAIWAHAKLNGVDFRALGNEPSWLLEIVKGENIIFANFYNKINRYMFIRPEPEIDQATGKTVFSVTNKDHALLVTIMGIPCKDTMSGELFDFSVTVKLDDKLFTGCGRSLL